MSEQEQEDLVAELGAFSERLTALGVPFVLVTVVGDHLYVADRINAECYFACRVLVHAFDKDSCKKSSAFRSTEPNEFYVDIYPAPTAPRDDSSS